MALLLLKMVLFSLGRVIKDHFSHEEIDCSTAVSKNSISLQEIRLLLCLCNFEVHDRQKYQ